MIPLVIVDLDGTMIGSSGTVQECVWQAVEKAKAAGVKAAVCTGRPCGGGSQKVAQRLGPNNPHIFHSGAVVSYPDGRPLSVQALPGAVAEQVIAFSREHNLVLELYTPAEMFVERKTPLSEAHAKMIAMNAVVRDLKSVSASEPIVRAQWVVTSAQLGITEALKLNNIQISRASSPVLKDTYFISITQAGVSKGSAVEYLAKHLKMSLANIMAVGDSRGDLPMLERVGHPVVMANSEAELLARYPTKVGDVENCGAAAAFELALRL